MALRVGFEDETCRLATLGPISLTAWLQVPKPEQLEALRRTLPEVLKLPDPLGILVIALDSKRGVSITDAVRGQLTEVFRLFGDRAGPTAVAIEGSGFTGAFVRSLMTGVFLLVRGRRKSRIFARRAEAVRWLRAELGAAAPPAVELDAAVEALTRDLK
jgi:hypothetical protein